MLKEAERLCPDGFEAFKQSYCPELGRSRVYELLAVRDGRKAIEDVRAATRARVAKHRASKRVTDSESVTTFQPSTKPQRATAEQIDLQPSDDADASAAKRKAEYAADESTTAEQVTTRPSEDADDDEDLFDSLPPFDSGRLSFLVMDTRELIQVLADSSPAVRELWASRCFHDLERVVAEIEQQRETKAAA